MKCPYSDIGCHYIDDVSHDCEAESMGYQQNTVCPHEIRNCPANNRGSKETEESEDERSEN